MSVFRLTTLVCLLWFGVSAHVFSQSVDLKDALIIDVRTQAEWQDGHLDKAILIPWQDIVIETDKLQLAKDQPIALYCRSGNRAGKAMALLQAAGYQHVVNLGSLQDAAEALQQPIIQP